MVPSGSWLPPLLQLAGGATAAASAAATLVEATLFLYLGCLSPSGGDCRGGGTRSMALAIIEGPRPCTCH